MTLPFGKQKMMVGLAVRIHDKEPEFKVKDITRVLDTTPIVTEDQLRMWNWIADYYMSPIGEVFNAALPAGLKAEDGFRPKTETYVTLPENLRHEQALHIAFGMLKRALAQLKTFNTYLTLSHWDTIVGDCTDEPVVEVTKDELINESHATAGVMKQLLDKKMLVTYEKEVGRLNCGGVPQLDNVKRLSAAQQEAYNNILFQFLKKNVVLLCGVTSSGRVRYHPSQASSHRSG